MYGLDKNSHTVCPLTELQSLSLSLSLSPDLADPCQNIKCDEHGGLQDNLYS